MKAKSLIAIGITLLLVFLDQFTKILVKTTMRIGEEINVLGHWFNIHFIENEGMAMGLSFGGEMGKYSLSIFRIIAIIAIIIYLYRLIKKNSPTGLIIVMSLILAGAIGNVIDCMFYGLIFSDSYSQVATWVPFGEGYKGFLQGNVVDMVSFQLFPIPEWVPGVGGRKFFPYIFNVADAAISIGIFLLFIFQNKFFPENAE